MSHGAQDGPKRPPRPPPKEPQEGPKKATKEPQEGLKSAPRRSARTPREPQENSEKTFPRRLLHCLLLHFPDQGNSPGDLFLDGLVGRRETSRILRRFWSPRGPSPARQPPRPKHALNRQGRMVLSCFLSVNERTDVAMATTKMALMMSMATRRRQPPREDTHARARAQK